MNETDRSQERALLARAYEQALVNVARATDADGRAIILLPPLYRPGVPHAEFLPASEHVIKTLQSFGEFYFKGTPMKDFVFLRGARLEDVGGTTGHESFLRNMALLANAAAAAMAYERSK